MEKGGPMNARRGRGTSLLVAALATVSVITTSGCFGRYAYVGAGTTIDALPHGYVTVMVGTVPYYYSSGVFYRPHRHGYVIVPAPAGAVVMAPPRGSVPVRVGNASYRYHRGVFYAPRAGRVEVVRPPRGAFVRSLPKDAVTRRIRGVEYKEYEGTYYRPTVQSGRKGYQVAEAPGERERPAGRGRPANRGPKPPRGRTP
jgi:hypothetical protein